MNGAVVCFTAIHTSDAFWGHFIALGDRAGLKAAGKLRFILVMVAISDHISDSSEATATAILAAISNFAGGSWLAPMAGSWLIDSLGITKDNYSNLPWAILVRTLNRLIPLIFIPFLVPTGSSLDKKRYDTNDLKDNNTTDIDIEKNAEGKGEASQKQELARLDDIDLGTSNGDKNHTADDTVQDPEVSGSPRSRGMFFGKGLRILRSLSSGLYIAEPIVAAPNGDSTTTAAAPAASDVEDEFKFVSSS